MVGGSSVRYHYLPGLPSPTYLPLYGRVRVNVSSHSLVGVYLLQTLLA